MNESFRPDLRAENPLNAKLHLGYEPGTEFKGNGLLLSAVPFAVRDSYADDVVQGNADIGDARAGVVLGDDGANAAANGNARIVDGIGNAGRSYVGDAGDVNQNGQRINFSNGDVVLEFSPFPGGASGFDGVGADNPILGGGGFIRDLQRIGGPGGGGGDPQNPPLPDTPPVNPGTTVDALPVSGDEGTPIPLTISITAPVGSTQSILITGVPAGATLSAGINNGNGSWTLTPAQLAGLTITPPPGFSGTLNLGVVLSADDNGTITNAADAVAITVNGVATPPNLNANDATGNEGTAIPLNITASLNDNDGSETLAITIANVPAGAILSAGIDNGNGTWILTPAQLVGLTITPPPGFSGALNLIVMATSSENGTTATVWENATVTVTGVASMPNVNAPNVSGNEDTAIPLNITASLNDNDGSEILSILVDGVPAGATLSAGIDNGDGSWTLTPAQLAGLTIAPPLHFSGTINLTVTATSTEGATSSDAVDTATITVNPVADPAIVVINPAAGNENTAIALDITATLVDNDGSETLSILVSNVPAGATLSAGINNGNGSWTLTPAQLAGLTITPPPGLSGDIMLTIAVTTTDGADTETVTQNLNVTINGVATPPTLVTQPANGDEDTAITLDIAAALVLPSGGEVLSIEIANVPAGATLSAGIDNSNGTWTLTPAQLVGLTITPPLHFSGTLNLTVTAIETDGPSTAMNAEPLVVTVDGVADDAQVTVAPANGDENTAIHLSITANFVDNDGSETMSILISGVPAGAVLSAGVDNGNGTWTLTRAQLTGLTLTPPPGFAGDIQLGIAVTTSENATNAVVNETLDVSVTGAADAPNIAIAANIVGAEDSAISLNITASLNDNDGSEVLSVLVSGVPAGAILSAGIDNGNGTWSLTPAQLAGLTITPPLHFSGAINLSVTAISTENNGDYDTVTVNSVINVLPVPDAPILVVSAATGSEDSAIALDIGAMLVDLDGSEILTITISGVPLGAVLSAGTHLGGGVWSLTPAQLAGLTITPPNNSDVNFGLTVTATARESDNTTATDIGFIAVDVRASADVPTVNATGSVGLVNTQVAVNVTGALTDLDGSETLTFIIDGVPDGFALTAGVNNGDNTWTVTAAQLTNLRMIAPYDFEGTVHLRAIAVANDNDASVVQSAADNFVVCFGNPLAAEINLFLGIGVAGIGVGVGVGIGVNVGDLLSPDGIIAMEGSTIEISDGPGLIAGILGLVSYLEFSGVPAGASFNNGNNMGGGVWRMTPAQLNNLELTLGPNGSADFTLVFSARLITLVNLPLAATIVRVVGVADEPNASVNAATGNEDSGFIPLVISASLNDLDGSETLSITLTGIPAGFVLSAGINNGDGSWSLTPAQLAGLGIRPPQDFSGVVNYNVVVTATESEGDSSARTVGGTLTITADADAALVNPGNHATGEDNTVLLDFGIILADNDGSEEIMSITISGLPVGASLLNALDNGNGTWSVDPLDINNVSFVPPNDWHGDVALNVNVVTRETSNADTASTNGTLNIRVDAVADAPSLTVNNTSGNENTAIDVDISAALNDTDGSETLSVMISGVPNGITFSAGLNNGNGSWSFAENELINLSMMPPDGFDGNINLTVTATSLETGSGDIAQVSAGLTITVNDTI